ncbi:MAG: hypothetical protein E7623_05710 [Ruminococcaceae bacterium]|nr:hypothetical protein [Oscillospiraceae bacterium]
MMQASPIRDKSVQEEICGMCGVKYDPDALAYSITEDGKITGICQFGIKGKCGYIYDLENVIGIKDNESLFIVGRAAMNFIDLCGVHEAYYVNVSESNEAFVKALGFRKNEDGRFYINMEGFFTGGCKKMNSVD